MGLKKKISCMRRGSSDSYFSVQDDNDVEGVGQKKQRPLHQRILIGSGIGLVVLLFILFLLVWVLIPVIVWLSIAVQRFLMFIPIDQPSYPQFHSPETYNITEVINFYITTKDLDNESLASIGCWLIVPEDERNKTTNNVTEIITNTKYDILFYLHGVAQNRAKSIQQYGILRKYFLIISVDHRGYGDSGNNVTQSEQGIISDNLQMYDWLRLKTQNDVYYWGHSLGSALTAHTVRALKETKNVVPKGIVLESPFTTMREEILNITLGQVFSWLAYFNATVLYPLDYNGFQFYSTTNILYVDCPIMILHAEDDNVIPYFLGKRLAEVAQSERNMTCQGSVTYHQFPPLGYMHVGILQDPNVPLYIEQFKSECVEFKTEKENLVQNGTCQNVTVTSPT